MTKLNLLLLHGALGAAAQFDALVPALADTYNAEALDFEGHGKRPSLKKRHGFRIEDFAADVLGWLDSQKIATIDVFGYSMGGYVALYLAHTAPERVGRIMTLGTKVLWTMESAAKEAGMMNPDTIEAKVPHFARTLEARHALPWQLVLRHTREMMEGLGADNLLHEEVLTSIPHPIRVVVGDRDTTVSVEEAAQVFRTLPNGQLEVLPDTGHPLEKVGTERLAGMIRGFFRA
jgi:pimeloyl-ACP methyl ester carboxylesterase